METPLEVIVATLSIAEDTGEMTIYDGVHACEKEQVYTSINLFLRIEKLLRRENFGHDFWKGLINDVDVSFYQDSRPFPNKISTNNESASSSYSDEKIIPDVNVCDSWLAKMQWCSYC